MLFFIFSVAFLSAADWPMWRCNAERTAITSETLPDTLHLQWVREYPPLKPAFWQVRQERLQFDLGYEPVVMGKTMFIGSSHNDKVFALDTDTGAEKWHFYAEGPVRLAPVALDNKVYFASDDGCLYCLDAGTGKLLWQVHGSPSNRKALGNGRMISVWPARGGPVLAGGRIYFTAGIWPFDGIFVYALDAQTGKPVWINDRSGYLYTEHPHNAMSFGGPAPQGYLLINNGRLVVPNSRAFPAFFDLATGKLLPLDFGHGGGGSRPGSWFLASTADGNLCVDPKINTEIHDGGPHTIGQIGNSRKGEEPLSKTVTIGGESYNVQEGISELIHVGKKEFRFSDRFPGVEGLIHTMLVADGKLFVVTRAGSIYCFGGKSIEPRRYPLENQAVQRPSDSWTSKAETILRMTGQIQGYALLLGLGNGRLSEELALQSQLHVVTTDGDPVKIEKFRYQCDTAGLYGQKIAALVGNPKNLGFPSYFANLIVCEDLESAGFSLGEKWLSTMFQSLRPYGGTMCLETTTAQHRNIRKWIKQSTFAGTRLKREKGFSIITRAGALPGAENYTGSANYDQRVKVPLGLLWFGDTIHHHKLFFKGYEHEGGRGLPTHIRVVDGSLRCLVPKEPQEAYPTSMKYLEWVRQYSLKTFDEVSIDVYTGREMSRVATNWDNSVTETKTHIPTPLIRRNPITGIDEVREFIKTYGCDTFGADYGNIITMRSGTAAFYDKRLESGTINISGTRSGCRNSIVPACGVLTLPSWTGNCTCNYPIFTSVTLAPMPPEHEQWSAWGGVAVNGQIKRVGVNFGAPGDRMTENGTLWLDWPDVGGPSPEVCVRVSPESFEPFYHHSLWMHEGQSWPWVFASGISGMQTIQIDTITQASNVPSGNFSVRWTGMITPDLSEEYIFHTKSDGPMRVWINNRPIVDSNLKLTRDGNREASSTKVALNTGTKYDLRVEYKHTNNLASATAAFAELSWSSPSTPKTIIPSERFSAPDGQRGCLSGMYSDSVRLAGAYENTRLSGTSLLQNDPNICFKWGHDLPAIINLKNRPVLPVDQPYTVRLFFAEPEKIQNGQRVFSVHLQGKEVLKDFDIIKEAGGYNRGIIREFKSVMAKATIEVKFASSTKPPLICGIELIAEKP
ncbi:MAG: PA14 domain-containing protein [Kiritimatiellae bacterium]|nr:PA14 domain-containing protein [Kiritimatiellia bacterium]MDD5521376.1 PA14 domain-containing protein [Kiritimatiellia bacterium]